MRNFRSHPESFPGLKQICLLLIFFSVALTGCDGLENGNTETNQNTLEIAEAYFNQGQYRAASIEARNAIQKDKNNISAYVLLAKIANELGQFKSAISQLEQVTSSDNLAYTNTLAKAYIESGKFYSARDLLENSAKTAGQDAEYHILLSRAYIGLNKPKQAKKASKSAIEISKGDPKLNAIALANAARINFQLNQPGEGIRFLDESITLHPLPQTLLQKAAIAFRNEDFDSAETHLSNALIETKETDIISYERLKILEALIQTLTRQGRSSEALIYSKLLAEKTPQSEEIKQKFEKAIALFKAGDLQAAEDLLTELYSENNNDISGRMLGLINALQGDLVEADNFLSQHVDPETASPKALKMLAGTKMRLNKGDDALEILAEKLKQQPDNPTVQSLYGVALLTTGNAEQGEKVLESALKSRPGDPNLSLILAEHYVDESQIESAESTLEESFRLNPNNQKVIIALSKIYLATNNSKASDTLIAKILKSHPKEAFSYMIAGTISLKNKQSPQAINYFNTGLKLEPKNEALALGLSKAYIAQGEHQSAINTLDKLLNLNVENPQAYKVYITAYELLGDSEKALTNINKISQQQKSLWSPHAVLAEYYLRNKNPDKGLKHLEIALKNSDNNKYVTRLAIAAYSQSSRAALAQKEFETARGFIMNALQLVPNNPNLMAQLSRLEITTGATGEAKKIISQMETIHPDSVILDELKGDLATKEKSLNEALTHYRSAWSKRANNILGRKIHNSLLSTDQPVAEFITEWKSRMPSSDKPLLLEALRYHESGELQAAIQSYENTLKINPKSLPAINNLSWIKFENGYEGALELAAKGADLYPNNAAMLDTYGWILFNRGQTAKAREILKTAHNLNPENQEIKTHYQKAME